MTARSTSSLRSSRFIAPPWHSVSSSASLPAGSRHGTRSCPARDPCCGEPVTLSPGQRGADSGRGSDVIFKAVRDGRPYPDHGLSTRDWAKLPPRQVRLDELITTKRELELDRLLDEDSTFYGDLFPHAVQWEGDLYLEDGLHRALRAALQQRNSLHVRVLSLDEADEVATTGS